MPEDPAAEFLIPAQRELGMVRPMSSDTVALVIGSGGLKCAAALGLWKVLRREGIELSMAVGCSGGSIYASVIASDMMPASAEEQTLGFWTSDLMSGYTSNLRAALGGETRFTELSGLLDDAPVFDRLYSTFGEASFSDVKIPLKILATDLYQGDSVVLESGRIVDAIRASIAIPMVFRPAKVGDRWLVDGAVSNPLPVDVAIKYGAGIILAVGFETETRKRLHSYVAVTQHFNTMYMNNLLHKSFAFGSLAHHAEILPVLPEFTGRIGTFDETRLPEIIDAGEAAMEEHLPYLRRLLAEKAAAG